MINETMVSVVRHKNDIYQAVEKAVNLIGGIKQFVKQGSSVLLKPNLAYPYPPPATTDPLIVEAIVKLCKEAGAGKVGIGDSTSYSCKDILGYGKWTNLDVYKQTGMINVAEKTGAEIEDFDWTGWRNVQIPNGIILRNVELAAPLLDYDTVINIPAMKTHFETLVTLGIKNYHGVISDSYKIQFHKDEINQKLVDIHKVAPCHLTIMDGLVAMQGLGPRMGTSVRMDLILASSDVVSLDAVASEIMGIKADEPETTRLAHMQGLGVGKIDHIKVLGCSINEVKTKFERPDNRISGIYPDITIIKGGPCIHCYGRARIFLDTLKETGIPDNGGISHLFVGVKPKELQLSEVSGKAVFIGDCALDATTNLHYSLGKRAYCLEGCPPIPSLHRVIDQIADEHKDSEV